MASGAISRQAARAMGRYRVFSLGNGKLIIGGELGAAVTHDAAYRDRMLVYGHVNRVPDDLMDKTWTGNAVGMKLRPHLLALVLVRAQLPRYDRKRALPIDPCQRAEAVLERRGLLP
jgi:dTDP-4-amino-4,6-dideoxygalactose transaminase